MNSTSRQSRMKHCVDLALTMMETSDQVLPEIEVECRADPNLAIDEAPVTQMLMSLFLSLSDLIEERGEGVLLITLNETDIEARQVGALPEGKYGHLTILGHGAGISAKKQKDVSEPFLKVDKEHLITKLRLDRSEILVSQQGGWITATNVPDCGTVIHLYFPVVGS